VPIPGYGTKNTISLRLWEAKARAEDLDLFQFNEGEYELAAQLHSRAQQVMTRHLYLLLHLLLLCGFLFLSNNVAVYICRFALFYIQEMLPRMGSYYG